MRIFFILFVGLCEAEFDDESFTEDLGALHEQLCATWRPVDEREGLGSFLTGKKDQEEARLTSVSGEEKKGQEIFSRMVRRIRNDRRMDKPIFDAKKAVSRLSESIAKQFSDKIAEFEKEVGNRFTLFEDEVCGVLREVEILVSFTVGSLKTAITKEEKKRAIDHVRSARDVILEREKTSGKQKIWGDMNHLDTVNGQLDRIMKLFQDKLETIREIESVAEEAAPPVSMNDFENGILKKCNKLVEDRKSMDPEFVKLHKLEAAHFEAHGKLTSIRELLYQASWPVGGETTAEIQGLIKEIPQGFSALKTAVSENIFSPPTASTKEQAIAELEKLMNAESFLAGAYQQLGEGVSEDKIRSEMKSLDGKYVESTVCPEVEELLASWAGLGESLVQLRAVFDSISAEALKLAREINKEKTDRTQIKVDVKQRITDLIEGKKQELKADPLASAELDVLKDRIYELIDGMKNSGTQGWAGITKYVQSKLRPN